MKSRRLFLSVLGLSTVVGLSAGFIAQDVGTQTETKSEQAKVGEKAPDFTLKNAEGEEISLSDFEDHVVVLQWINPDCPVCRRVNSDGTVETMLKELEEIDEEIVHLAINSTHYMDEDAGAKYFEQHKIESEVLVDKDGTVGRLYDAKTTPHMYVIDEEGVLRYDGAIDDNNRGTNPTPKNYVVNAVRQIKADETVAPDEIKPYGCGVKYAKKKAG